MIVHLLALAIIAANPTDKIRQAVQDYLNRHYAAEGAEYLCETGRLNTPAGFTEFDSVAVLGMGKDSPLGKTIFNIGLVKSGELIKTTSVVVDISSIQNVVVAGANISPGAPVTSAEISRRAIKNDDRRPLSDLKSLEGKQARVQIQSGSVIYEDMLENKPLVNVGDKVTILLNRGQIKIEASGIARQKGGKGDLIRVSNSDSRKIIVAEVVDSLVVACK